jgi:superfamily II DNA or RNA helicase
MTEQAQIRIRKLNHAFLKVESEFDIALEMAESLTFEVPGAKYSPAFKMGQWDGKIRLFNMGSRTIASGLYKNVLDFASSRGYSHEIVDDSKQTGYEPPSYQTPNVNTETIREYMESLNLHAHGDKLDIREYQIEGVVVALRDRQAIIKASVGSGKSMILYCVCRYLNEVLGHRVLILVPTVGLTTQMRSDFADYASETDWRVENNVHMISSGADHSFNKPIVISTFQSLKNTLPSWFNDFGCIFSDEGHSITAKSFQDIYGKATEVPFRLACTGTLHDLKCNILQMQGLTGPVTSIAETKDLIDAGQLVPMKVKSISLNYPKDVCKLFKKVEYDDEIHWLSANSKRNTFIKNLAVRCSGTTLVFFRFIEHGKELYKIISEAVGDTRKVFLIDGGVSREDREAIRLLANTLDAIVICSFGTMKAGVNLPAIENIIIGHPIKGGITFLQSLGRGLRLKKGKTHCNLFDIGDNLAPSKSKINHTYKHFGSRIEALTREGYEFTLVNVEF